MQIKSLFRDDEANVLQALHSQFKKAVARYHAKKLDFISDIFAVTLGKTDSNVEGVDDFIHCFDVLSAIEKTVTERIEKHSLLKDINHQQSTLINQTNKLVLQIQLGQLHHRHIEQIISDMKRLDSLLNRFDLLLTASLTDVDELTGLLNRASFERNILAHQAHSLRTGEPLCLALIDADNFKSVNDNFGHNFGDYVLETIATEFEQNTRPRDEVYRYGGEEFLILLPNTSTKQAFVVLERLRCNTENTLIVNDNTTTTQTISIGLTEVKGSEQVDNAIERADQALYDAKESGRNQLKQG